MKMIKTMNIAYSTFVVIAILSFVMALPVMTFAGTIQLPQTGQTKCYDSNGNQIPCAGTGQDGEIQAGVAWPNPRFTDNGNGTVTDNLTGLMWTKDANPVGNSMTWQQALDYVQKLNTGGHTDWRLPNANELNSLVDYSVYYPALPLGHPFTNVQSYSYWSSTTSASYPGYAWVVYMSYGVVDYGNVGSYGKSYSSDYAWPVRAGQCGSLGDSVICLPKTGQTTCWDTTGNVIPCTGTDQDGDIQAGVAWPNPRFTDHGDGTVTDKLTGLMWTKDANPAGSYITWQQALDYVQTLNTGGHTDWRLPNANELHSLVDYSQSTLALLPLGHPFTNVYSDAYWSCTTVAGSPYCAWIVIMYVGSVNVGSKSDNYGYRAWPVRAGQGGPVTTTTTIEPNTTTTTTVQFTTTSVPVTTTVLTTTTTIQGGTTTTIPTTTTTICPGPCPCVKIYGEQSEETELLRKYRDNVLSKTPEGQVIIEAYCAFSPTITKLLEQRPLLKNRAKLFIDGMLPGIRKKVEESNEEQ